jgi:hypothetical protein
MDATAPKIVQSTVAVLKDYNKQMDRARAERVNDTYSVKHQRLQYDTFTAEARAMLTDHLAELDGKITQAKEKANKAETDFAASLDLDPAALMLEWDALRPFADLGLSLEDMLHYVSTPAQYAAIRHYGPSLALSQAVKDRGGHLAPYALQRVTESFQTALRARAERIGLESEVVNSAANDLAALEAADTAIRAIVKGNEHGNDVTMLAGTLGARLGRDMYTEVFAATRDGKRPRSDND